jgi:hypothetical protein
VTGVFERLISLEREGRVLDYGARGVVGLVKTTYRPVSMESFIKLMPEGMDLIPAHAGIRAGNEQSA